MGTKIFNGLPIELKNEMNLNVFKRKLKGSLLCNVFYSLQEFLISSDMDCRVLNSFTCFIPYVLRFMSLNI
jgi:hypothetical protein